MKQGVLRVEAAAGLCTCFRKTPSYCCWYACISGNQKTLFCASRCMVSRNTRGHLLEAVCSIAEWVIACALNAAAASSACAD